MRVTLTLEPVAGAETPDAVTLRRLLKALLRRYGWRCASARAVVDEQEVSASADRRLVARTVRSVVSEHPPGTRLPVDLVALPAGWRMVRPALVECTAAVSPRLVGVKPAVPDGADSDG